MINPIRIAGNQFAIIVQPVLMLALALVPWPVEWERLNDLVASVRSADRNRSAAGYYEHILGGPEAQDAAHDDSSLSRLIGKPEQSRSFAKSGVVQVLSDDLLLFELKPSIEQIFFSQPFVTNQFGMHDDPITQEKPPGTFRVAVLGASIDMGWGIKHQDTYVNRLEEWLNIHADRLHVSPQRRFEVLNFGVAAYSPLQRLEVLHRKVKQFQPDMVIFSATTQDPRLTEINLCDMLAKRVDLKYDFVRQAIVDAGVTESDLRINRDGDLVNKDRLKRKLERYYWKLYDETIARVASECRSNNVPLAMVIIPRVGSADAPTARAEPVARLRAIAGHHALNAYDLTDTFDRFDVGSLEISPGDDHPNAFGHERLFLALARAIVDDHPLYRWLFPLDNIAQLPSPDTGPLPVRTKRNAESDAPLDAMVRPAGEPLREK
jgi:hypothetical protein